MIETPRGESRYARCMIYLHGAESTSAVADPHGDVARRVGGLKRQLSSGGAGSFNAAFTSL
eukprot:scaffold2069_cov254-Pinguiococcus_pyrenoidosus.AAC.11